MTPAEFKKATAKAKRERLDYPRREEVKLCN
jgi:hypothetical protein